MLDTGDLKIKIPILLIGVALFAFFLSPLTAQAEDGGFLLDRTIPWGDGTRDRVQVGRDGYLRLNEKKMRLVGIDLGTTGLAQRHYEPASLAIYEKELAYLESVGIRLVHVTFGYEGYEKEKERYSALLDLFYRHKMLVFPLVSGKWLPHFGNLTKPDFQIGGRDSLGKWAGRWCDVMAQHPNVVAVAVENELDIPLKPPAVPAPQEYKATEVTAYMKLLTSIIRSKLQAPVVSKLVGEVNAAWSWRPDIKEAVLPFSDVPCLDVYFPTEPELNTQLDAVLKWLKEKGAKTDGFWVGEANAGTGQAPRSADFTTGYLDCMFNHGAAVVCLWTANRRQNPSWAFFDGEGKPGESLLRIAADLKRLQAPLSEPTATASVSPFCNFSNTIDRRGCCRAPKNL